MIGNFIIWEEELDSTQDLLKRENLPLGTLVVANFQTNSRGRQSKVWHSHKNMGLYFSFLIPKEFLQSGLSLCVGLSILEALESFNIKSYIKWPNDIYMKERESFKKVSGALIENTKEKLICGVGINLYQESFEEEIKDIASSVYLCSNKKIDKKELLFSIIEALNKNLIILKEESFKSLKDKIETNLLFLGEEVKVDLGNSFYKGEFVGIDNEGQALLKIGSQIKSFNVGDIVSFRKIVYNS